MRNLEQYVASELDANHPLPLQQVALCDDAAVVSYGSEEIAAVRLWSPQRGWFGECEWPLFEKCLFVRSYFDGDSVLCIFSNGDIVRCSDGEAVIVGSLGNEVLAAEWSPTGEFIAVVLETNELIVLSVEALQSENMDVVVGRRQFTEKDSEGVIGVRVGWGKRETQFKGRGPRAIAQNAPKETDPVDDRKTGSVGKASVSWRGDGEVLAVNICFGDKRVVFVCGALGELESASEPTAELTHSLAYEPRGSVYAVGRSGAVQLFERNGLRRAYFPVDTAKYGDIKQLGWSADSRVLAVVFSSGRIELYVRSNWHWYRKRVITGLEADVSIVWHPEMPCTLGAVLPLSGKLVIRTFILRSAADEGLAAVVDADKVLVTPISRCCVPPPLSMATLELPEQPSTVATCASSDLVAVALPEVVRVYTLNGCELQLSTEQNVANVQHLWFSGNVLYACTAEGEIYLLELGTQEKQLLGSANGVSVFRGDHYMAGNVVYNTNGSVVCDFNEPCVDFCVREDGCYGLTRRQRLLRSGPTDVVDVGVTSMLSAGTHLVYTKIGTMRFISLNKDSLADKVARLSLGPVESTNVEEDLSREIESGSLLVAALPQRIVLQAPRGNLETVHPRVLVAEQVAELLANNLYSEAFRVCRTHRLRTRVLYDADPEKFMKHSKTLMSELGKDADLLLSELSGNSEVLDALMPQLHPHCRITALCVRQPPLLLTALEEAAKADDLVQHLLVLCDAQQLYRTALSDYKVLLALRVAQQAQMDPKEYLPFLQARQRENTNRSRFNIDVMLRRFDNAIQNLVKSTDATPEEISSFAIRHGLHDLAIELLEGDEKWKSAYSDVLRSRAEELSTKGLHSKAGVDFEQLGDVNSAVEQYILGCCWQRALALVTGESSERVFEVAIRLAEVAELDKKFVDAARVVVGYLNDPKRALALFCKGAAYDDAVLLARTHSLGDMELHQQLRSSFGVFAELLADCRGQAIAQIARVKELRELRKRGEDPESVAEAADGGLSDAISVANSEATGNSVFTRYTDRSGASSGTARTGASRRTLKNARRRERKQARGKKGSVYEEDYLLSSLGRLAQRLLDVRQDCISLEETLRRCGLPEFARTLRTHYNGVLNQLEPEWTNLQTAEGARIRFDDEGNQYEAPPIELPVLPEQI